VLFSLATLEFLSALEVIGKNGVAQAFFAGLTWLSGLGAVWLLWRPASPLPAHPAGRQHRVLQVGQGGRLLGEPTPPSLSAASYCITQVRAAVAHSRVR
jgi:hypothetical protein